MSSNCRLVIWVSSLLLVSVTTAEMGDVIYLDLAPLRVLRGEAVPDRNPSVDRVISPKNGSKIYCSDTTFPNDIYCDLNNLGRVRFYRLQPVTTRFYWKYSHPTRSLTECFISFENSDESSPSRLGYKSFSCYHTSDSNSTAVWLSKVERQMKRGEVVAVSDVSFPETLMVRDIEVLEFEDRSTENLSTKCKWRYKKVDETPQGGESVTPSAVTFVRDSLMCISSAPPMTPPSLPELLSTAPPGA